MFLCGTQNGSLLKTEENIVNLHKLTMNTSRPVEYFILEGLKDRYVLPIFFTVYVFVLMTIPKMLSRQGVLCLTVMAFDRYIAICKPLWYTTIMTTQLCILLIFASWGFGAFMVLPTTIWATQLPYCGPNIVRHMFCDYSSVVSLACIDTTRNGILSLTNALIAFLRTFLIILISHVCIGKAMRKMSMAQQLKDAATCVSHLTVVCISYISASFVYISYRVARFDPDVHIVIAVLYSVLTPLLNPIIYSLRNTELQDAMKRAFCKFTIASKTTSKTVPSVA
uniref:Odorant receptor, family B, subfamily 101, member 1 n=1 Tax=Sinocyclocheilus anshuiensis TaxID=1608454 RepID=A0A671STZ7_9TELE